MAVCVRWASRSCRRPQPSGDAALLAPGCVTGTRHALPMVRALDLRSWAGCWVAVDAANHVRCDAPKLSELLDANGCSTATPTSAKGTDAAASPCCAPRSASPYPELQTDSQRSSILGPDHRRRRRVRQAGGEPVARNEKMMLRLGASTNEVRLYDLRLKCARPPTWSR